MAMWTMLNGTFLIAFLTTASVWAQTAENLETHGVAATNAIYQGKDAVRIDALSTAAGGQSYAILKASRFHNGTIEFDLAGEPCRKRRCRCARLHRHCLSDAR